MYRSLVLEQHVRDIYAVVGGEPFGARDLSVRGVDINPNVLRRMWGCGYLVRLPRASGFNTPNTYRVSELARSMLEPIYPHARGKK